MNLAAAHQAFEGRVPGFLLKGAMLTAAGGPVIVAETPRRRGGLEAQDWQEASEGPDIASEPEKPATDAPSPAVKLLSDKSFDAPDPERQAALAELAQLSVLYSEAAAENERLAKVIEDAKQGKGSSALGMSIALRKLAARHNVRPVDFAPLPLLEPIDAPQVRFKGIAASDHVDDGRMSFHPACWGNCLDNPKAILLCLGHDEAKVVGTLETVELRAGAVWVTGAITDKAAMRMPALSISVMVEDHVIRDPDDRYAYRGEVTKISACREITLTDHPQNAVCKITERWPVTAADLIHQEMLDRIRRMRETIIAMSKAA
jgi:hypothetical protein